MGSGECAHFAPGVFALNQERKSIVLDPAAADEDTVRLAAECCPNFAITVTKTD